MKIFLTGLFEYNHHQNQNLVQVIFANRRIISKRSLALFSHMLTAHQTWNRRILEIPPDKGIWEELAIDDLNPLDEENFQTSVEILMEKDLESLVHYRNSKGEAYSNSIRDILFHIINHSTYHRGQIASDFKITGMEPLVSDYIFYKRRP